MKKIFKIEYLKEKLKAFSLVEVMVSLIVISAVSAAFAPVMIKKVQTKKLNLTQKMAYSSKCPTFTSPKYGGSNSSACGKCTFCDLKSKSAYCIACSCDCPTGSYKLTNSCTCATCAPSCAQCTTSGECKVCNKGYYLNNKTCTVCPAGYYCSDGKTTTDCPEGYYCPKGASNKTPCVGGKWSAARRTTACTDNCTAGYYCNNGKKQLCAAGTYSGAGAASCTDCEKGYYCTGGANRTACPGGKFSETLKASTASVCTNCTPGTYSTGGAASCSPCAAGTTSNAGASSCTSCNVNNCIKYSSGCVCSACSAGFKPVNGSCSSCSGCKTYSSGCSCASCNQGSYLSGTACVNVTAKTGCNTYSTTANKCSKCNAGYYLSNGECKECKASSGHYSNAGATSCSTCAAGQYAKDSSGGWSGVGLSCGTCSTNYSCKNGYPIACSTAITGCSACNATAGTCNTCSAGYYKSGNSCVGCPSKCSECSSASKCTKCKSGYTMHENMCYKCNNGFFVPGSGCYQRLNGDSNSCAKTVNKNTECKAKTGTDKGCCYSNSDGFFADWGSANLTCKNAGGSLPSKSQLETILANATYRSSLSVAGGNANSSNCKSNHDGNQCWKGRLFSNQTGTTPTYCKWDGSSVYCVGSYRDYARPIVCRFNPI